MAEDAETSMKKVVDLGKMIGASIVERDISIAHRLPSRLKV